MTEHTDEPRGAAPGVGETPRQGRPRDLGGVIHPGEGVLAGAPMATRREFAAAAAATAASAILAAGAGAARASEDGDGQARASSEADAASSAESEGKQVVTTTTNGVTSTNLLTFSDETGTVSYEPTATFDLPEGSLLTMDCDRYAAILRANDTARPLTVIECLDVTTGTVSPVLSQPISGDDYAPSECRITSSLVAWVEMNNATDEWKLYAAPFAGTEVVRDNVVKLSEGDAEWLPAQFAVWDDRVVWQVMPDASGSHVTESSIAYLWRLGQDTGTGVWTSRGRFGCAPDLNAGILTIAPRVNADSGTYYGITSLDVDEPDRTIDQLVLPASVKPFFVTTIGSRFAFSIEANYGYGGTFGSMGTYVGPSQGPFYALQLEPSAQVNYVGGLLVVRSSLSYYVFDLDGESFTRIYAASNCSDAGDYPATSGTSNMFLTYALVRDEESGLPSGVSARIFSLT